MVLIFFFFKPLFDKPGDLWDPNVYSGVTEYVSLMTPQMNEIGDDSMKSYSINREVLLLLTPFLLIHIYVNGYLSLLTLVQCVRTNTLQL